MKRQAKRILIAIDSLKRGGGAERVAANLCNQLASRGYEVHVLTFYHYPRQYPVDGVCHDFRETTAKTWFGKAWKLVKRCRRIREIIRKHRIDLTISHLDQANTCILLTKLGFFERRPMVVSVHNYPLKKGSLHRALIRRLYPFADGVVSVSHGIEEVLQNGFGLTNTATIYNPIDAEGAEEKGAEPLAERYRSMETHSPLFITTGSLSRQKGQWHLIRAFQKVARRRPGAALVILGEGRLRTKLERLVRESGLDGKVFLPGIQENVFPFLKAADCFVFTSLWEGMPNALIEALAMGLPIISTDCPTGPREILAPELPLEEVIFYPYKASHGTLIAPFSNEEFYASIEHVPLSREEDVLADLMLDFVDCKKKPVSREGKLARFGMEDVMDRWEHLIQACAAGKAEARRDVQDRKGLVKGAGH